MKISTRTFGEGGLLPRRQASIGHKSLHTPAKTLPESRTTQQESFADSSRHAAELYAQVDSGRLREARNDPDEAIIDRLEADKVDGDVMVFPFLSFQDGHAISPVEAQQIVDNLAAAGDIVTVPLQPKLARAVEPSEGVEDAAYQSYKHGVERVLQAATELEEEMPVMGTLPMLGWTFQQDLLELSAEHGVDAYTLNFDRKRITAGRQVSIMQPLARYIADRVIEEETLIYGINLNPRDREWRSGVFPAANFAAVGFGVDVVGETHVPPRGPAEMFEGGEGEGEEETPETFKLFEKDSLAFREYPLEELPGAWPDDSEIEVSRAIERSRAGAKSRMEVLVNAEQMAIAMQELQQALDGGTVIEYLDEKDGVTEDVREAFQTVRDSFDDSREQSGLGDFS